VQQGGETTTQAHATLRGTLSKDKHEILFGRFNINYNEIDERFKKGSILVRQEIVLPPPTYRPKETGSGPGPSAGPPDQKQAEETDEKDDPPPKAEQKEASKKKRKVKRDKPK